MEHQGVAIDLIIAKFTQWFYTKTNKPMTVIALLHDRIEYIKNKGSVKVDY